jgi:peptidase S41-like protein/tricorn protease-like protein
MNRLALVCLVSLVFGTSAPAMGGSSPSTAQRLDGLWLSDGYGLLADIGSGALHLLEVTPFSCMSSETYALEADPPDPRGARFASRSGQEMFQSPAGSPEAEWFHSPSAASSILFHRVSAKPESCGQPPPNNPQTAFEIFAWTFRAHHGFLKHRGVDWAAVTAKARPQVKATTKPSELFDLLESMIEPLHDEHTFLEARDIHRGYQGERPGTHLLTDSEKRTTVDIIEKKYLQGPLRSWCEGHLQYARLKQGGGYLRVDSFMGYVREGGFDAAAGALATALDEILRDAAKLNSLIIDARLNGGGDDPLGLELAARLTQHPYVAYVKRARNDPEDPERWTAPQTATVSVGREPRFAGKVVELIGPDTVSAGETFSMALMGRRPSVVRIGEETQGVYSDILVRSLPNGWRFGLPNEVFLTADGRHFEASGIPPDLRVAVFPKSDLVAGRDGALERALAAVDGK